MISIACFLLLAATRVGVTDDVYAIPPRDWRYVEVGLQQRTALIEARYNVNADSPGVRLQLMRTEEIEKLRAGEPHAALVETPEAAAGRLDYPAPERGDYALVIFNRAAAPASVRVRIWLDFPTARQLSPERRRSVILISFAVFFGIVTWSARRLLKAVRR